MRPLRLAIAAAGTGGHVYPGVAVARAWCARGHAAPVFLGTSDGFERHIVPRAGYALETIASRPLRGGVRQLLTGVAAIPAALRSAVRALRSVAPDVVFGTGGHASGIVVAAARRLRIPTLLLECNAVPGFANRAAAPFATAIAVAWPDTWRPRGSATIVSGVPVRAELFDVPPPPGGSIVRVLVFGGSAGSERLDTFLRAAARRCGDTRRGRVAVTHITPLAATELESAYRDAGWDARIVPYVDDMAREYAACSLVVANAGASTCAELAATGRPGVLVPLDVSGGHQHRNAAIAATAGYALVTTDEAAFAGDVTALIDARDRRATMAACAAAAARPDAAGVLVSALEHLVIRPMATPTLGV